MFKALRKKRREEIRAIARKHFITARGDGYKAYELTKQEITGPYGSILGTILLSLALKLAWELIKHWIFTGIRMPTESYEVGEPGK